MTEPLTADWLWLVLGVLIIKALIFIIGSQGVR